MFKERSNPARRRPGQTRSLPQPAVLPASAQHPSGGPQPPPVSGRRLALPSGDRGRPRFARAATWVAAMMVLVLAAASVEAACGISRRISFRNAECLDASWENNSGWYSTNSYDVRNMCSDLGRVVAKVDLREGMDRTLHLHHGWWRRGYTDYRIRGIYCCSDLSTACNRSDVERNDGSAAATTPVPAPDDGRPAEAWLGSFGHSVASEQVDLLGEHLTSGNRTPHLTLGGHRIDRTAGPEDGDPIGSRDIVAVPWKAMDGRSSGDDAGTMTDNELMLGSSFLLASEERDGEVGHWSGWGATAPMSFAQTDGAGSIGLFGMDYEKGRLLTGVALSRAAARGGHAPDGIHGMATTLDSVHPYARLALTDRLSVWSALGFGTGDLASDGGKGEGDLSSQSRTGIAMSMAAMGARGDLLTPEEVDGFALSVNSDAYLMRLTSEAGPEAEASRLRVLLDGSRSFGMGTGSSLTTSFAVGLRHEGGAGAAGTGVELGAELFYATPGFGMSAQLGNFAGQGTGHEGWGASLAARYQPWASGRLSALTLTPFWDVLWCGPARPVHRLGVQAETPLGGGTGLAW